MFDDAVDCGSAASDWAGTVFADLIVRQFSLQCFDFCPQCLYSAILRFKN
jgi:hypothetical protein